MKVETNMGKSTVASLWQPSVQLRFLVRSCGTLPNGECETEKVLQQLHTSNLGERKWLDVPTVNE